MTCLDDETQKITVGVRHSKSRPARFVDIRLMAPPVLCGTFWSRYLDFGPICSKIQRNDRRNIAEVSRQFHDAIAVTVLP